MCIRDRYYTSKVGGSWQRQELASGSVAGVAAGQYTQMVVGSAGNVHIVSRLYSFSALFGSVYYLKMHSAYFADDVPADRVSIRAQNVTFSAAPKRHYSGMAIALDDDNNLVYSAAVENTNNNQFSLYAGWVTTWAPQVKLLTPSEANHDAENSEFEFTWESFDPEAARKCGFLTVMTNGSTTGLEPW